jgi:hypothetical protein
VNAREVGQEAADAAREVGRQRWVQWLARAGYAASGLIHILIGWIAAQVALGGGGEADQTGALGSLRSAPGGPLLLWACVVGFAALALWHVVDAVARADELKDRVKEGSQAAVYAVLAFTALSFARGGGSSGEQRTDDLTGTLMGMPFGRVLVGAVGVTILVVGGYHIYKGLSDSFLDDLRTTGGGTTGRGVLWAGRLGYPAKGLALIIVGLLFLVAAWQADPEQAGGLDAALKTLSGQPLGTVLLLVIAVGLVLYGIYSFARARYARM